MGDVADADQRAVAGGAALDATVGPVLDLGDRRVLEGRVAVPGVVDRHSHGPADGGVDRARVGEECDALAGVPPRDRLAGGTDPRGELAQRLAALPAALVVAPDLEIGPRLRHRRFDAEEAGVELELLEPRVEDRLDSQSPAQRPRGVERPRPGARVDDDGRGGDEDGGDLLGLLAPERRQRCITPVAPVGRARLAVADEEQRDRRAGGQGWYQMGEV